MASARCMTRTVSAVKATQSASNGSASRQFKHQRRRQQHDDEDERGKMLAEERHPQPPQRVGAGEHDFQLPARMRAGVVGQRQLQDVLEEIGQHKIAAPVREPVGEPCHQRGGDDDEQAEADPCADERREHARGRPNAGRKRAGQRIDDMAEQHRLDELRHRQRDIGDRKRAWRAAPRARAGRARADKYAETT